MLVEQLGAGTSADVFRAYDPRLDRDVALKLLTPFYSGRQAGDVVIAEGRLAHWTKGKRTEEDGAQMELIA